ncbi:hypothetical protein [Deinococcus ruber]|uniref:Uncharacterized protein n=1 Tax=Deinococcus ruber TaxID=1848197 RepID=A0A918FHT5_9DEIO|nr:hypothetical protein [Deinococcus ruber]GGR38475.1 hypothetical protein GCM10008957_54500 [Deinococcus ruber]
MKSYWLGVPVLAIALAACGGGTSPPVPDVMIPATTKVADTATRTALSAFDPKTGTMLFSSSTPVLQTLAINDVLSGDRSPAAPDGFLRRVVAIR